MGSSTIAFDRSERVAIKTITFAGGTTDAIGDIDGANNPFDIFTVTGNVLVKLYAICETTLVGASATLEVGITGDTAVLIAQTTAASIATGEIWHDASPDAKVEASTVVAEKILANGNDIIGTAATANITAGVIKFICVWTPLDETGNVQAA